MKGKKGRETGDAKRKKRGKGKVKIHGKQVVLKQHKNNRRQNGGLLIHCIVAKWTTEELDMEDTSFCL